MIGVVRPEIVRQPALRGEEERHYLEVKCWQSDPAASETLSITLPDSSAHSTLHSHLYPPALREATTPVRPVLSNRIEAQKKYPTASGHKNQHDPDQSHASA